MEVCDFNKYHESISILSARENLTAFTIQDYGRTSNKTFRSNIVNQMKRAAFPSFLKKFVSVEEAVQNLIKMRRNG